MPKVPPPPPDAPDDDDVALVRPPKKLPLHKRYPNQWCTRSVIYTPQTRIEFTGPIPDHVGELLLAVLAGHRKSEKDPALKRAMKTLERRLIPPKKAKG